jgi:hypothetical protein
MRSDTIAAIGPTLVEILRIAAQGVAGPGRSIGQDRRILMSALDRTIALALAAMLIGGGAALGGDKPKISKDIDQSVLDTRNKANSDTLKYELGETDVDPSIRKTGQLEGSDPLAKSILAAFGGKPDDATRSVGLRELPFEQGRFVGWVYSAPSGNPEPTLSVGLFSKSGSDATSVEPIGKPQLNIALRGNEHIAALDFAPYVLGPLGRAFGIRTTNGGCGAGGSICWNGYLKLFVPQNGDLQMVFNDAVSLFGNYGGEWNKDGTRQHTVVEENGVIIVKPGDAAVPDLILQARIEGKLKKRTYKPVTGPDGRTAYKAASAPIISLVDE